MGSSVLRLVPVPSRQSRPSRQIMKKWCVTVAKYHFFKNDIDEERQDKTREDLTDLTDVTDLTDLTDLTHLIDLIHLSDLTDLTDLSDLTGLTGLTDRSDLTCHTTF